MRKLTIFKRLVLGFLLILLLVTALGLYSNFKLDQLNHIIRSISSVDSEIIRMSNRLRDDLLTQRKFERKYVVSQDKDFHREFLETQPYIEKHLEQISVLSRAADQGNLFADLQALYNRYLVTVQTEVDLITNKERYAQQAYENTKENLTEQMMRKLEELTATAETAIDDKITLSSEIGSEASKAVVIITIVSLLLGVLIALFNARTINRPIRLLIAGTKEIARGKFEKHLDISSPPEIHQLANEFNHMSERLKELDEIKADLIAHMSHEFRTPLAVIREAVSLQLDGIESDSKQKQRRLLAIVGEECERLIISVNKVLNLSRMDAGMMDYHVEECSLSQVIDMSVARIKYIAERKKIALEVSHGPSLPHAAIDAEKIGQVIDNLLDNALKFTPERGRVSIRADVRATDGEIGDSDERFLEVSISDTGCGIPRGNIRNVFDKFKKLHEKGTGLGLYIARQIVKAHGGDIWVKSEENRGSTFYFTVPVF